MHLSTMRARRAVNHPLEALDAVGPRPREAAIEFLRGKIAGGEASLDTADEGIFVLDASRFERVWAAATLTLCGQLLTVTGHPRNDGWRLRGILEADVRYALGLDTDDTPPLSLVDADLTPSIVGSAAYEQLLKIIDNVDGMETVRGRATARAELIRRYPCQDCGAAADRECFPDYGCTDRDRRPDDDDDPVPPAMRDQMRRAQHRAAVRFDCGCGAPAGLECRCTDEQRLFTTPERTVH